MQKENDEILFTASSPLNYPITLYKDTFENHIRSMANGHNPHMEFTADEVKEDLENPVLICNGNQPNTHVYFAKSAAAFPNLYLQVAVNVYKDTGDVSTAHLAKDTSHGTKGIIYVDINNKL